MAEFLPHRRNRKRNRARHYGAPNPRGRGARGKRSGWGSAARELGPILWALPLAVFTALALVGVRPAGTVDLSGPGASARDVEAARFSRCGGFGGRDNCVVDGDTLWYRGQKIRIADINTPETS